MARFFDSFSQSFVNDAFEYIGRRSAIRMEQEAKPAPRTGDDFSCAMAGDYMHPRSVPQVFCGIDWAASPSITIVGTHEDAPKPQPDADGWIAHDGKGVPVPDETLVLVRMRDGWESEMEQRAGAWHSTNHRFSNWIDSSDDLDIVAYRVVSQ